MMPLSDLARVVVEIDGASIAPEDARALGAVRVQQRISLPTLCELTFFDPTGPFAAGSTVGPGSLLRVAVEGEEVPLFVGQITAVHYHYGPSGQREIRVRGYDVLHQLRKRQPVCAHVDVTVVDLARSLIQDLGLEVEAEQTGPVWHKLVQYRQSDLEMISEVAERCGLYFALRDGLLHFMTLEGIGAPVPLKLGDSLLEVRVDINSDSSCRSVETLGWDPWRAEHYRGEIHQARVGRRTAAEAAPGELGGTGVRTLADEPLQEERQAEALAQAELDRRVAGEVTLRGVAQGDPSLRPGTPVEVSDIAPPIAGRYVLTAVTHTLDRDRGFLSEIDTAPPVPRPRSRQTLTSLGTVTQVNDPEGLGRVRVSLPSYGGIETDWLGVLLPGAGAGKGLVTLPDVQDQVLVLFMRDDPAQGIVLGGMYGASNPPDEGGVLEGAIRRYSFLTPGGQRVHLDDQKKTTRIENSEGSFLELSPGTVRLGNRDGSRVELSREKVRIHAEADLEIEAPGKTVVIRGQFVNFERG